MAPPTRDRERLRSIAREQRWLLLCILTTIGMSPLQMAIPFSTSFYFVAGLVSIVCVALVIQVARRVYNLWVALFFGVLVFVPLAGLIGLFIVNQRATSVLRNAGFRVGLLGVAPSDLR